MTYSKLNSITLSAGPSLKLAGQNVTPMAKVHLDAQLIVDSSARARDLLLLALALADEDMGWASWLDERWLHACKWQRAQSTDELREDPCWILIPIELGEGEGRVGWRIVGARGETAFLKKPLGLLSDAERGVLLGWRIALPEDRAVTLREALDALGRALGAMLTDDPQPFHAESADEIFEALSARAAARQAEIRKD